MHSLKGFSNVASRAISLVSRQSHTTLIFQPILRNAFFLNVPNRKFSTYHHLLQQQQSNEQKASEKEEIKDQQQQNGDQKQPPSSQEAQKQPPSSQEAQKQPPSQETQTKQSDVNAQQKQLEEINKKLKEYENKYLSSLAEAENTRRIAKADIDNARKFGHAKFAESLLEVVDNLGRALNLIRDEDVKYLIAEIEEDSNIDEKAKATALMLTSAVEGIRLTEKVLLKTLENNHVKKMTQVNGSNFDPKIHDAVAKLPAQGKKANTVLEVVKDGFMIHDRVLRPAQVVVAVEEQV